MCAYEVRVLNCAEREMLKDLVDCFNRILELL